MKRFQEPLLYLLLLGLWFGLLYGSANFLAGLIPYRIPMGPPTWSFRPQWAPVYLSLNLLVVIAFFAVNSRARLFTALLLQTALAWPVFMLLPLQALPLPEAPDSWWFAAADALNLEANFLPSLHVSYALTCAYYLRHPVAALWALLICLSTLLTYQHYPLDVVVGAGLAVLAVGLVHKRLYTLALCFGELVRCSVRQRRYALIAVALLGYLLVRPRAGWRALLGFCYLQRIDDLLDGHLQCSEEPEEVARNQIERWRSGRWTEDQLDLLARSLQSALPEFSERIMALITEMVLDRKRVRERLLLPEALLKEHLERTFSLSLDLMLAASEATVSSANVPSLSPLLGWCSVVRDLKEDLELGLLNVPEEIVASGRVREWFESELEEARLLFQRAEIELKTLKGRSGHGLLKLFHRSVEKYFRSHRSEQAAKMVTRHYQERYCDRRSRQA